MRRALVILLGVAAVAVWPAEAPAAIFNAACTGSTGDVTSLKNAITQANATPASTDTVALGQGCLYELTAEDNFWYGPNGLPPIASDITIEGNGGTVARAGSSPTFRIFFVGADPANPSTAGYATPGAGRLTLRDVTVRDGLAEGGDTLGGGGGAGLGGAIFSQGSVVVERSTLTANAANGGSSGQAIFGFGGGAGLGEDVLNPGGGGMGLPPPGGFGGGSGGQGTTNAGGGGGGFTAMDDGAASNGTVAGAGGGASTGTGGFGGFVGAAGGNGSGGGGDGACGPSGFPLNDGSPFGQGGDSGNSCSTGNNGTGGGGGGVGGGGGAGSAKPTPMSPDPVSGGGGGGGFGGGGGRGFGPGTAGDNAGGDGGFGGGSGQGQGATGDPGFGGGIGNTVSGGGGAGMGGAIFNMQGELTIRNSTLAGNSVNGGQAVGGAASIGKGMGGAVFNLSGTLTTAGSTFAGNSATTDGASIYNLVYDSVNTRTAAITLSDTILVNDSAAVDLASDRPNATLSGANKGTASADIGQFNLVRTSAQRGTGTVSGSALTGDPLLGSLTANGGPTPTMAPAEGSPVIDAGSAFGLTTDQRGLARPSDFALLSNADDGSDIGAVEVQVPAPPTGPGGGGPGGNPPGGTTPALRRQAGDDRRHVRPRHAPRYPAGRRDRGAGRPRQGERPEGQRRRLRRLGQRHADRRARQGHADRRARQGHADRRARQGHPARRPGQRPAARGRGQRQAEGRRRARQAARRGRPRTG